MAETCLAFKLLLLRSLSAGKYKNIQNGPLTLCPTLDILPTIRAMTKLTISGDYDESEPVTIESSMTEADFSGKILQASGAIMLAAFLPKCRYKNIPLSDP